MVIASRDIIPFYGHCVTCRLHFQLPLRYILLMVDSSDKTTIATSQVDGVLGSDVTYTTLQTLQLVLIGSVVVINPVILAATLRAIRKLHRMSSRVTVQGNKKDKTRRAAETVGILLLITQTAILIQTGGNFYIFLFPILNQNISACEAEDAAVQQWMVLILLPLMYVLCSLGTPAVYLWRNEDLNKWVRKIIRLGENNRNV